METAEKMTVTEAVAYACAQACMDGRNVTISMRGKRPRGFPKGELLSIGTNGEKNYSMNPVKVLSWIHALASVRPNVELSGHEVVRSNAELGGTTTKGQHEDRTD